MKKFFNKIQERLHSPVFTTNFHKWATLGWIILIIPTLLFWKESITWIVLMSVWANIGSHWAAYQASRAELKQDGQNDS